MIKIKNLSFSYPNRKVIEDISIEVADGEFLAILGTNGAGKSTFLKLVSGELKSPPNTIEINKKNIETYSVRTLAKQRAVLEQEISCGFNYTVIQTVLLGRYSFDFFANTTEKDIKIARDSLKKVGLEGFETRMISELSGGEKRRVHLARVLAQIGENPATKVLLLDEPSSGLDPAHSHIAMKAAKELSVAGASVIAILHDPNLASTYADSIALLKDGKFFAMGNTEEIINKNLLETVYGANCEILTTSQNKKAVIFPSQ